MENILLYSKLAALPEGLKSEVEDFIDFLSSKNKRKNGEKKPKFGCCKGLIIIKPGFDEPLEDFKEYMH